MPNTVGDRLVEERRRLGMKQIELSSLLSITPVTMRKYEQNSTPIPSDKLGILYQHSFNVSYIITGKTSGVGRLDYKKPNKSNDIKKPTSDIGRFSPRDGIDIDLDDYAWIPLYNVEVSAGNGRFTDQENVLTYFSMTKYSLRKRGLTDFNQLGYVIVHGDSMFDTLHPNDCIMINFAKTNPDGGIFVLRVAETLHVKRLIVEKKSIRVISDNSRYPEWTLDENDDFEIIGKYEWHARYAK